MWRTDNFQGEGEAAFLSARKKVNATVGNFIDADVAKNVFNARGACFLGEPRSIPSHAQYPSVVSRKPAMTLRSVLFPHPDGPRIAPKWRLANRAVTSSSSVCSFGAVPTRRERSLSSSTSAEDCELTVLCHLQKSAS